ncbi:hypothetical protein K2X85_19230 [bacterium]|nr:hypothetical protein [bacterium]
MNYFAHGFRFVDEPYFLAGTAIPDWMGVVDRRHRLPPNRVRSWLEHEDPSLRSLAAGIIQHHHDDDHFHSGQAFSWLQVRFARSIKELDPNASDLVKYLLAHIVPELMLDAFLIEERPGLLDAYYDVVLSLDASHLSSLIAQMSGKVPESLPRFLGIFVRERFLADYADDDRLCFRLGQILARVGWGPLPEGFSTLVPSMRRAVHDAKSDLVAFLGHENPFL